MKHWIHGGTSDLDNLVLLCSRHHWMVHEGRWQIVKHGDEYTTIPPPYRVDEWARGRPAGTGWPKCLPARHFGRASLNLGRPARGRPLLMIDLIVEVMSCPTVCRHCWALGTNYSVMPLPEVAAHPQAADLIRLFAQHDWVKAPFQPFTTTGVPLHFDGESVRYLWLDRM